MVFWQLKEGRSLARRPALDSASWHVRRETNLPSPKLSLLVTQHGACFEISFRGFGQEEFANLALLCYAKVQAYRAGLKAGPQVV